MESGNARPFMTFHVGQAGVQIGSAIWELLCLEHNINMDGTAKAECPSNGQYDAVFLKSSAGHFMPRSIFLDTDPSCIDEVRTGPYRSLFSANQLVSDRADASGNYMRGRQDYATRLVPSALERFRRVMEKTDVAPAVFLVHGLGGGTGTGLAVSCLESLHSELDASLQVFDINVSTGRSGMQSSCEAINSVLYHYESRDFTSMSFSVTNSALYNICRSSLQISNATFTHLNRMLAMCFSNLTALDRFAGTLPCSFNTIQNSLRPFRGLKHVLLACCPFPASGMVSKERLSTVGITSAVMERDSQLADVDLRQGKHLAGVLLYRGAAKPSDVDQALTSIRTKGRVEFVEWAPAVFKTGLLNLPPLAAPSSGIDNSPLSVTLVSNHSAVSSLFRGQSDVVKKLMAGGYFVHNYEASAGSSGGAGHNSSISNLLKEACDHMDELSGVYEKEQPPLESPGRASQVQNGESPGRASQVQNGESPGRASQVQNGESPGRASQVQNGESPGRASQVQNGESPLAQEEEIKQQRKSEMLQSKPNNKQSDIEALIVALEAKDSSSQMQEEGQMGSTLTQTNEEENSSKCLKSEQNEDMYVAERMQYLDTPVTKEVEQSEAEESQLPQNPDPSKSEQTPIRSRSTKKKKGCCDKSEKSNKDKKDRKDKKLPETQDQEGHSKSGKKKRSNSKCRENPQESKHKKDKSANKEQAQKEDPVPGERKIRSRSNSGCRKRSSDRTSKKKMSGRKVKNADSTPVFPAQNHASSALRPLTSGTTSIESDISDSVQRIEGYNYSYQRRSTMHSESVKLNNGSNLSKGSTTGPMGISEIIQSCLSDDISTSNTINNVKQVIQKYNNMFAKEA